MAATIGGVVLAAITVLPSVVRVPVTLQMLLSSTATIFFGSARASMREAERKAAGDDARPREVLGGKDVYRFPITASATLLALFLAFKYLPKEWVSRALTIGSVTLGAAGVASVISPLVERVLPGDAWMKKRIGPTETFSVDALELVTLLMAAPIGVWYAMTKHCIANNLLAVSLAYSAVEMLGLEDFQSGAVLLSGLFFYDVFWVFYSKRVFGDNVMVAVAKQFEGPIKVVFPKFPGASDPKDHSLLGLGDIVLPGIFIAMLFRFDEHVIPGHDAEINPRYKPYFTTNMVLYVAGLLTTNVMMLWFEHAQPALLYLVPACLGGAFAVAAVRKELGVLIKYSESEEEKESTAVDGHAEGDNGSKKEN